jgi:hypothetical protein
MLGIHRRGPHPPTIEQANFRSHIMKQPCPQEFLPESLAYQNALGRWRDFQEVAKTMQLDKMLCRTGAFGRPAYVEALNLLPPAERRPVAFGELARYANEFLPQDHARIRELILPDASACELDTREAVKNGSLSLPDKLPVTLEEFPSRIWQRAMSSGSPGRLVVAGYQAVDTTLRLLSQIDSLPETDSNGGEVVFHIDIGDAPEVFDLIALAPREHLGLKTDLINALIAEVEADETTMFKEQFETIAAWVLLDDEDKDSRTDQLLRDTLNLINKLNEGGEKSLKNRHRLRKLGRLLFRLGHRREALRAARTLGVSAWSEGWQFQPIGGMAHAGIRKRLLRPKTNADAWQHDPALACSAMSLPLWLADGVSRVPELMQLFNRAGDFPWVFPRLSHVFQWHLAIAGKSQALREIQILPESRTIGFSRNAIHPTPDRSR